MASRDIANMHLFLEMKKKFPELPEDIIRKHIIENSDDHEKCLHLLNEEKKNYWCSNPSFADYAISSHLLGYAESHGGISYALKDASSKSPLDNSIPCQQSQLQKEQTQFKISQQYRGDLISSSQGANVKNVSHTGIVHLPFKPLRVPNTSEAGKAQSAPVVSSDEQPFSVIYKNSVSSHYTGFQFHPNDHSVHSDKEQVTFSAAEEHLLSPHCKAGTHVSDTSNAKSKQSLENPSVKHHTIKLSIEPAFPCQLQYGNIGNLNTTPLPGSRHTTSVNLQLRPPSADQHPIAVTATPMGKRSDADNYNSHVQISVSSTGATFTARRLQKSPVSRFHPRIVAGSSSHQNSLHSPNRPTVLNIPRHSSQFVSGRQYFYPESRLHRQSALHARPDSESAGLPVVPEIPQGYEPQKLKPDWLHFMPSPNPLEFHKIPPSFQVTASMYPSQGAPRSSLHQEIISPSDEKYRQAVLKYQKDQMEILRDELKNVKEICLQLRAEVTVMEKEIKEVHLPAPEEVQKLKEEIQKLRLECSCLLIEVDSSNTKEVPYGITDEDFYSNIFTGPVGPIPPVCESSAGSQAAGRSSKTIVPEVHTGSSLSPFDDDDERPKWKCSACTWLNHPAMEICDTCFMKRKPEIRQMGSSQYDAEDEDDDRNKWTCKHCTYLNHPALDICESCDQSRRTVDFFDKE